MKQRGGKRKDHDLAACGGFSEDYEQGSDIVITVDAH